MFLEIILFLLGCFVTNIYYKKSLIEQEKASQNMINELRRLIPPKAWETKEGLRLKHIEQGVEEYKRAGTPKKVIDTFNISQEQKAEIYDTVLLRVKGRPGKSNPYR